MTYKELIEILKEIQDDCKERRMCQGCKFYTIEGCALQHIPDEWNLDLLYIYPEPITPGVVEKFYEALEGSGNNGKQ